METPDGDPVRYADRDVIGVEAVGEATRGINEARSWLTRVEAANDIEHDASGYHATLKIPVGVLRIWWDSRTAAYSLGADSYLLGTTGSTVATVSRTSAGVLQVTLASALSSTTYRTEDASAYTPGLSPSWFDVVAVRLSTITSATVFEVKRYQGTDHTSLTLTDGDLTLLILAEP